MLLRALSHTHSATAVAGVMPKMSNGLHQPSPPAFALPEQPHIASTGVPVGVAAAAFLARITGLGLTR